MGGTSSTKVNPIHKATENDLNECLYWSFQFFKQTDWAKKASFDVDAVEASIRLYLEKGVIFLHSHGMIAGMIYSPFFDPSYKIGQEAVWFAEKGGKNLLTKFEEWCIMEGADTVEMTHLNDENEPRMRKHFGRLGYTGGETHLYKELK